MTPELYADLAMLIVAVDLHLSGRFWWRSVFLNATAIMFFLKAFHS
jgi:hypothetical protein